MIDKYFDVDDINKMNETELKNLFYKLQSSYWDTKNALSKACATCTLLENRVNFLKKYELMITALREAYKQVTYYETDNDGFDAVLEIIVGGN